MSGQGLRLISSQAAAAVDRVPSVGYFAGSFPRDTVEFSKYSEQVAIGQVLETLVAADANGELAPMLAESWAVLDGGLTLRFSLRRDVVFSNGKPLTARDAAYSLGRHWHDASSQSHGFLKDVVAITADDDHTLTLRLNRPRVAIFKVLSRDQLGILPEGSVFDPNSREPYIGTGPYRLVREHGHWFFVKNPRYRDASAVAIPKWCLSLASDPTPLIERGEIPDVVLTATQAQRRLIDEKLTTRPYHAVDQISFAQASIWWYPHGRHYLDKTKQKFFMGLMRELVTMHRAKGQWSQATGIVPVGVSGYLPAPVEFPPLQRPASMAAHESVEVHVGVYDTLKPMVFGEDSEIYREVEKRFHVRFKVETFTDKDYAANLPARKPDIVIDGWFGGFNDPEGFLLLLPKLLHVDFNQYLGAIQPVYAKALVEQDWQKRAALFRTFNQRLVAEERLVPTWRVPTYTLLAKGFEFHQGIFRYTPRLTDVSFDQASLEP